MEITIKCVGGHLDGAEIPEINVRNGEFIAFIAYKQTFTSKKMTLLEWVVWAEESDLKPRLNVQYFLSDGVLKYVGREVT